MSDLLKNKDPEPHEVDIPDSVCLMKFSEVMALGKKHPIDILKRKYVELTVNQYLYCACVHTIDTSQLTSIQYSSQVEALVILKVAYLPGTHGNPE